MVYGRYIKIYLYYSYGLYTNKSLGVPPCNRAPLATPPQELSKDEATLVIREAQATCVRLADDALGAAETSQRPGNGQRGENAGSFPEFP